jgi:cephalosporin hydroxylase
VIFFRRPPPAPVIPDRYPDPVRNPGAEVLEVDTWMISEFIVHHILPFLGVRPFPLNEQLLAVAAACRIKPSVVFDWGTHVGASARLFYECAKAFDLSYEVHSIDLPADVSHVEHPGEEHARLVRGLAGVHLHRGDGATVALEQWNLLGRPARPLFFVDGDHAYASVLRELGAVFDAVGDASALVHDTFFQSAESGYNVGPARAIENVVARYPLRFTSITSGLGLPGMTLLADSAMLAEVR